MQQCVREQGQKKSLLYISKNCKTQYNFTCIVFAPLGSVSCCQQLFSTVSFPSSAQLSTVNNSHGSRKCRSERSCAPQKSTHPPGIKERTFVSEMVPQIFSWPWNPFNKVRMWFVFSSSTNSTFLTVCFWWSESRMDPGSLRESKLFVLLNVTPLGWQQNAEPSQRPLRPWHDLPLPPPYRYPRRPGRAGDDARLHPEEGQVPLLEETATLPPPGGRPDRAVQVQVGGKRPPRM